MLLEARTKKGKTRSSEYQTLKSEGKGFKGKKSW